MFEPGNQLVNVIQGEFKVSAEPDVVLSTLLGSCVAVCLSDIESGIGGMNHFLLPEREGQAGESERYGAYSMELLINDMIKRGARKDRMQAKLFGGASMIAALNDIGASNAVFAKSFLANERIPCVAESLGGNAARRLRFWPVSGRVRQFLVPGEVQTVAPISRNPTPEPKLNDITLF
ncbi:MAG: chemotaxis protein CheD [Paracoccaceae bacterium]|nr:chemotaxis protein CheD [Paracoccaceae bacterium]